MSKIIYSGMTENGVLINDMVDNNNDYVVQCKKRSDYFVRLSGYLRNEFDEYQKPALAIFNNNDPHKPVHAIKLNGEFEDYCDEMGRWTEKTNALCKSYIDFFDNEDNMKTIRYYKGGFGEFIYDYMKFSPILDEIGLSEYYNYRYDDVLSFEDYCDEAYCDPMSYGGDQIIKGWESEDGSIPNGYIDDVYSPCKFNNQKIDPVKEVMAKANAMKDNDFERKGFGE